MSNQTAFSLLTELSKDSKMSAPMQAHYINELMKGLKYEPNNRDISTNPQNQEEAITGLFKVTDQLNSSIAAKQSPLVDTKINIAIDTTINNKISLTNDKAVPSNSIKELTKDTQENQTANIEKDTQGIIRLMLKRIVSRGKEAEDNRGLVYKNDNYEATLRTEDGTQFVALDRVSPEPGLEIEIEALRAFKAENKSSYEVTLNTLTPPEIKALNELRIAEEKAAAQNAKNVPTNKDKSEWEIN